MAKRSKKKGVKGKGNKDNGNIRFIVPMPGKHSWDKPETKLTLKKLHQFNDLAGDMGLEDYQAQLLMQREYLID